MVLILYLSKVGDVQLRQRCRILTLPWLFLLAFSGYRCLQFLCFVCRALFCLATKLYSGLPLLYHWLVVYVLDLRSLSVISWLRYVFLCVFFVFCASEINEADDDSSYHRRSQGGAGAPWVQVHPPAPRKKFVPGIFVEMRQKWCWIWWGAPPQMANEVVRDSIWRIRVCKRGGWRVDD